jgi:hypothetical protein
MLQFDGDFVDGYLRGLAQAVRGGGCDVKAELVGVGAQMRCQRANDDGREFGKKVALHNQGRAGFAGIAGDGDGDEIAALAHASGHSETSSIQGMISSPPGSCPAESKHSLR